MLSDEQRQKAVSEIVKDLCNRKRLGDAWEETSPEAQEEIMDTWILIIRKHEEAQEAGE